MLINLPHPYTPPRVHTKRKNPEWFLHSLTSVLTATLWPSRLHWGPASQPTMWQHRRDWVFLQGKLFCFVFLLILIEILFHFSFSRIKLWGCLFQIETIPLVEILWSESLITNSWCLSPQDINTVGIHYTRYRVLSSIVCFPLGKEFCNFQPKWTWKFHPPGKGLAFHPEYVCSDLAGFPGLHHCSSSGFPLSPNEPECASMWSYPHSVFSSVLAGGLFNMWKWYVF